MREPDSDPQYPDDPARYPPEKSTGQEIADWKKNRKQRRAEKARARREAK